MDLDKNFLQYNNAVRTAELYQAKMEELERFYSGCRFFVRCAKRMKQIIQRPIDEAQEHKLYKVFDEIGKNGLNRSKERDREIIMTLTSYPARIRKTPAAIATLLQQTAKPDRIILWLADEDFPDRRLPSIYNKIKNCGVEIKFRPDLKVHLKWYYALKEYPEALVITVDDDIMYENDIVEQLYHSYIMYPNAVSALGVARIRFDNDGNILRYEDWIGGYKDREGKPSHQLFAKGVAGVLYPPHSLPNEAFNISKMKKLSPTADDVWLKFMEVMNGIPVVAAGKSNHIQGVVIRGTQRNSALGIINNTFGGNDKQMDAILRDYNQWYREVKLTDIMAYDLDITKWTLSDEQGKQ